VVAAAYPGGLHPQPIANTSQTKKFVVPVAEDQVEAARQMTSRGKTILASQGDEFLQQNYENGGFLETTRPYAVIF
jgi:hypothetical protein